MRTRASIKSHPVHPILVGFPITFLTAAVVLDALGVALDLPGLWTVGAWSAAAGIATALIAAVPGFIDYVWSVPPNSTAKKRATYHMTVNLTSVTLFGAAWVMRGEPAADPGWGVVAVEVAAMTLLTVGGYMGGTLVHRNFMGPDHRYADKGRWSEVRVRAQPGEPVEVAKSGEMQIDQMRLVRVNGKRVVLARTAEGYRAFDDHCTHRGASLADGVLICGKVQCLWHGSRFDVSSGRCERGPAEKDIATYKVEVVNGRVMLSV